jgi:hypothetical protein
MKRTSAITIMFLAFFLLPGLAGAKQKDIPLDQVPKDVIEVLNTYLKILTTSASLDECGTRVAKIAGGHMVNKNGLISRDVMEFSLKKDFQNARFYQVPAVITRVVFMEDDYDGFGPTLIQGDRYKIWIAKKKGVPGMPAPIPVMKPKTGAPKIVSNVGSL